MVKTNDSTSLKLSHRNPGTPPAVIRKKSPYGDQIEIKVRLLTPMLGGGAKPRAHDAVGWLRAPSVKGHLRFWWRALNAHTFETVKDMREREEVLFGAPAGVEKEQVAGGPGIVRIHVNAAPQRATQHQIQGVFQASLPTDIEATIAIEIVASGECAQIMSALTAWLLLGGAGGRTRRAAGAIGVVGSSPTGMPNNRESLERYLQGLLSLSRGDAQLGAAKGCFSLARLHSILIGPAIGDGHRAANDLQARYAEARAHLDANAQDRLGFARPRKRHASPVVLCVVATPKESSNYFPIVLVTRPHIPRDPRVDDAHVLDSLIGHLRADGAFTRITR